MPVGASPELPENADRVASVLRHAGMAALCRRRGRRGVSGRVSPTGRLPLPAPRTRQRLAAAGSPTMSRRRGCSSRGFQVSTAAGTALHRTRIVTVRHWLESPTGELRGPSGEPDRRPSRPDRRPSRPVVSPTYAQGSCYGTNRVVASAPGRFAGPAAPLLSTTRAAQPPGRDPSRSRCSVARTGRVSRKNGARGREGAGRGRESASASRVAIPAPTSTSSSSVPIVATTWRPPWDAS